MNYIIDSYSWVEYFIGSKRGKVLKQLFENKRNKFITIDCCLAEIKGWSLKVNQDFEKLYEVMRKNSFIFSTVPESWIRAGEERFNMRKKIKDFGLVDALILVKQKELNCRVVSGDKHFKTIKDVVYIGD